MNTGMLLLVMLLLVSGSSFVHSRHLDVAASSSSIAANGKQTDDKLNADDASRSREQDGVDGVALFDGLKLASIRNRMGEENEELDDAGDRQAMNDFFPYMGSFIFKSVVRRAVVKPMVKGFKRIIPKSAYSYYNDVLANRRIFKVVSPLSPAISSYAYNKFEQGVFWSIKRSYRFVMDNFIEFEERAARKKRHS